MSKSLSTLLNAHSGKALGETHVGMPAVVTGFTPPTATTAAYCSCQPIHRDIEGPLPEIRRAPVIYHGGSGFGSYWPLSVGDYVWLSFSERSLDEWLQTGGVGILPESSRRSDLSDAVVHTGLSPITCLTPMGYNHPTDCMIGGISRVRFSSAGKVVIGNETVDLLDIVDRILSALSTATAGGFTLDPATLLTLSLAQTALGTIKE